MRSFSRAFLIATCVLGVVSLARAASAPAARPNILLILTDDQGYGDLGCTGNPDISTPNIDRFSRESVTFDRFFVSPVCAPTRSSLMTGRWWLRTGVSGVTLGQEVMRAREVTIAETLRGAGYHTGIFGKWHNGEQYPLTPIGQGFEEFLGFTAGHWNNYFNPELLHGAQPSVEKGYITDILANAAISFIERNKANPFFCYVPFNAPHSPFQVPDKYYDKYAKRGMSPELASIYGMVECVDDNVGRLLATLDRLGLRENTIVLFFSDNGPVGIPRYNAGMRGTKGTVHEGGTRVPFFIRYPARFKAPRTLPQIAAHIDLYPTLLELCGVPLPAEQPKLDGVSLVPMLDGRDAAWRERLLFSYQGNGSKKFPGAVRSQQYRAVLEGAGDPQWSLFDMVADPDQKQDVAAQHADVVQSLSGAYEAWWKDVTKEGFAKIPSPVGHPEHNPVRLFAPQATLSGKIRFFIPQAYANTWITGWNQPADKISFKIDVTHAGKYAVALAYACPAADAGSKVQITSGKSSTSLATVVAAEAPRLPLAHRDDGKDNYVDRRWGRLELGALTLEAGVQTLTLQADAMPGSQVLELKHVELKRLD